MKLVAGDCIAIDVKGARKILIVTKMSVKGGATFTEIHESNVSARAAARGQARKKLKENRESLTDSERQSIEDNLFVSQIGVADLRDKKARRITISPTGELRDPGFRA